MNIIHYMHDKYAYESGLMALHDYNVTVDFNIEGEFPMFGNDDDRVDNIA